MKEKWSKNNWVWKCLECWSVTVSDYFGQGYSPDTFQRKVQVPNYIQYVLLGLASQLLLLVILDSSIYHRCQYRSNIITFYWCLQKIEIFWYKRVMEATSVWQEIMARTTQIMPDYTLLEIFRFAWMNSRNMFYGAHLALKSSQTRASC